ncbi:transcriptional regulator [Alkalihalobacillus sp. 1P02AB]|uniref:transcriptional regulator n=1 Tax=Alkalihalobacillus sp. 1P02AB TaxID=3132260 RepID=UPI0039A72BC0
MNDLTNLSNLELYVLIPLLIITLLTQSILLFINAKKRNKYPWFWGLWGLIQVPMPTLFYLLFVYIPHKKKLKKQDGRV